jgi:hypothetical protein
MNLCSQCNSSALEILTRAIATVQYGTVACHTITYLLQIGIFFLVFSVLGKRREDVMDIEITKISVRKTKGWHTEIR